MKLEPSPSTPTILNPLVGIPALVGLLLVGGCALLAPAPKITHHLDNLVVMDIPEIRNYESSYWGQIRICRTFYQSYNDDFDIVLIISNIPWGSHEKSRLTIDGFLKLVRNSVQGTGIRRFDSGNLFGSPSKLKGVLWLPAHHSLLLGYSLHEILHLWAVNYRVIPTSYKHHWGFSSVHGSLGGFDLTSLVELGDSKFSAAPFSLNHAYPHGNMKPYSELELYLAGFIPIEEVPDIWVAEDGEFSYDSPGSIETDENGNYIFHSKKISTWSGEKIVEKLGPRIPNHVESQKSFRAAVIVINNTKHPIDEINIKYMSKAIELFTKRESILDIDKITVESDGKRPNWTFESGQYNFWEATGGRGTLDADIASSRKETQEAVPSSAN